jgi:hypothetical protein
MGYQNKVLFTITLLAMSVYELVQYRLYSTCYAAALSMKRAPMSVGR